MSFLLGEERAPAPAPVPASPMASEEAARQREAAAREAMAERASAGRRSTIVGGMKLAEEEQQERGMLAKQKREASRVLG